MVLEEELHELRQARPQQRIGPHAKQRRIRLEQMQMRVHALRCLHVFIAEPHVIQNDPVATERLLVAAEHAVVGVRLDELEDRDRLAQARGVVGRAIVLGERIDGECLRVDMLALVRGLAVGVHHPEHAAMRGIEEMRGEIDGRPVHHPEKLRATQHRVCGGERPQNPGVEDAPFRCVALRLAILEDQPHEAAMPLVDCLMHPVRQDAIDQLAPQLRAQRRHRWHRGKRGFSRHGVLRGPIRGCDESAQCAAERLRRNAGRPAASSWHGPRAGSRCSWPRECACRTTHNR